MAGRPAGGTPVPLPVDPDLPSPPRRGAPGSFAARYLLAIALGGALGTLARYELSLAMPDRLGSFPWATLLINVSGSFLIGAVLTMLVRLGYAGLPRLFSCVGVLGGWTTMSTLALDADELVAQHRDGLMIAYVLASVLLGMLATFLGMLLSSRVPRTVPPVAP